MPKIISECFELMKLCDINCRSPFFETHRRDIFRPTMITSKTLHKPYSSV